MDLMKTKFRLFVLAAAAFVAPALGLAGTLPPIWIPATGSPITSWDTESSGTGLKTIYFTGGFEFPLFGNNYSSVTVASNGTLYFGATVTNPASTQPPASTTQFVQSNLPQIAPAWYNTQAIDGSGSILVDMLTDKVVITYNQIASCVPPACPTIPPSDLATFQVTLDSDGSVIFAYSQLNALNPASTGVVNSFYGSSLAIAGISSGLGVADPEGSVNLSGLHLSTTYTSSGPTIYQAISTNPGDGSNFAGLDLTLTPVSGLRWDVTADFVPSPEPATFIEATVAVLLAAMIKRGRDRSASRGRV
jgi:hypothetical protein